MDESGGTILVVEGSEAKEDHLPLETLRRFGLNVQVAHTSKAAITAFWISKPIVVFLAKMLDDGPKGMEVQAVIRAVRGTYNQSLVALDLKITPTRPEWRLNRGELNMPAKLYGLMKSVLIAQGFSRVLVVEDPRAAERIPERVFAPMGCVRIGTCHTAGLALGGAWQHGPAIVIVDEELGAGSTGRDFLRYLAELKNCSPITIGLSPRLTGTDLTAARGPDFEAQLGLVLRQARERLEQLTSD